MLSMKSNCHYTSCVDRNRPFFDFLQNPPNLCDFVALNSSSFRARAQAVACRTADCPLHFLLLGLLRSPLGFQIAREQVKPTEFHPSEWVLWPQMCVKHQGGDIASMIGKVVWGLHKFISKNEDSLARYVKFAIKHQTYGETNR